LTGRQFVTALWAIPLVVGIPVLIALRPHDVQELSGKLDAKGAEVVLKMEKIKQDIFARADTVQRLTEKSGEIAAFSIAQLWRLSPENRHAERLRLRDQLQGMLREGGIPEERVRPILAGITAAVARDVASDSLMSAARVRQDSNLRQKLVEILLGSRPGTAVTAVRPHLEAIDGWKAEVEAKVREFDDFRQHGTVPKPREGGLGTL
jgi:hypothetical protein